MGTVLVGVLAVVLNGAAIMKLLDRDAFVDTVEAFHLPRPLIRPISVFVPVAELVAAGLLLSPARRLGALLTGVLLGAFTVGIVVAMRTETPWSCGCFGGSGGRPVGWRSIARNITLLILCALVVWRPGRNSAAALGWVLAGVVAVLAGRVVLELLRRNGDLLSRLDATNHRVTGTDFDIAPRDIAAELAVAIDRAALDEPLGDSGMLLLFVDADCATCHDALPELIAIARTRPLAIVAPQTAERWGGSVQAPWLTDDTLALAKAAGVSVVPSLVEVRRDGVVRTPVSIGPTEIAAALEAAAPARRAPATGRERQS